MCYTWKLWRNYENFNIFWLWRISVIWKLTRDQTDFKRKLLIHFDLYLDFNIYLIFTYFDNLSVLFAPAIIQHCIRFVKVGKTPVQIWQNLNLMIQVTNVREFDFFWTLRFTPTGSTEIVPVRPLVSSSSISSWSACSPSIVRLQFASLKIFWELLFRFF